MARTAVALRHVACEDLGLLAPVLAAAGWDVAYRDVPTDGVEDVAVAEAGLLIVLGGPVGVYEEAAYPFLSREVALLEQRLAAGLPTLGICLGSQLMARALGARVYPGGTKEIGWGEVTLTEAGHSSCLAPLGTAQARVLHWHGDTFDLPEGAARLAGNSLYANQAYAWGPAALGLQFHLEADPDRLEAWYVAHAAELATAGIAVTGLRADTAALAPCLRSQTEAVFAPWLAGLNAPS